MAENRLALILFGILCLGSQTFFAPGADAAEDQNSPVETEQPQPPQWLRLKADHQRYDNARSITIAEGNVQVALGSNLLLADRIEFDSGFQTLFARGSVRLKRNNQFFQASALRYNLVHNEGELDDVYGVIDLEGLDGLVQVTEPTQPGSEQPTSEAGSATKPVADKPPVQTSAAQASSIAASTGDEITPEQPAMACPPLLPPVPDWHPQPWAVTAWGGQMIDAAFGDTFLFNGDMRPEAVLGIGLQKRIMRAGPLALELEADLFSHIAKQQPGGAFNQDKPYADLPAQSFGEGVLGIGARVWVQPWLSFSVVEGISYNTDYSLYEKTFRENYTQLLNYLGFEVEAAVSSDLSLVGRIHHRSGAFGTYSGVTEGSNAYLLGLRYRWGRDLPSMDSSAMPPPLGCPDPERNNRQQSTPLSERLESVALGDGGATVNHRERKATPEPSPLSPADQQKRRTEAIAEIDQRISDVTFKGSFTIERRSGIPVGQIESNVKDKNRFGVVKVPQLKGMGNAQLINGTISRWRIQAAKVRLTADGWRANRMGFSNDPFTPAQTRIDAEDVIAREQPNGDVLISARRNRLIVEERLPVPVSRRQLIQKEEEVENRWVLGIDNDDRDGLFVGRNLKPITFGTNTEINLQPQFMLQRAIDAGTDSDVDVGDLFGLEAKLTGNYDGYKLITRADISSFSDKDFLDNSRFWGSFSRNVNLGPLGEVKANLFGSYRYRTWNGSLGETDIQAAYGAYAEKRGEWQDGASSHRYLVRGAIGDYYAERFDSNRMLRTGRGSLFGSLTSTIPIVVGETAELTPLAAYRYSPVAIVPGLSLNTNINSTLALYGGGDHQESISLSGGPTITLGTFSKPFLDFTQITVVGGGTLLNGASPFEFDRIVDFSTLGFGITQQIIGPLVLSTGVNLNVDPGSEYYGEVINSSVELRWQRRSYDVGFYLNPYKGIGGVRFRLNDFDFGGTGVPFVPYTPANWFLDRTDQDGPPL